MFALNATEILAVEPIKSLDVDLLDILKNSTAEPFGRLDDEITNDSQNPSDYTIILEEAEPVVPHATIDLSNNTSQLQGKNHMLEVLDLKNIDVNDVVMLISKKSGFNIVAAKNVQGKVTVYLRNIDVLDALDIIVEAYRWAYVKDKNTIQIMTAEDYIQKFGYSFSGVTETRIKKLFYTSPTEIAKILEGIKSATGKIISEEKSQIIILIDDVEKLQEMERIIEQIDVPLQTQVFELLYADIEVLSSKITEMLTPSVGELKTDIRSNRIIVSDTFQKIRQIGTVIKTFDQRDREVLIEAKILQITLSDESKLGIDWQALVSDVHSLDLKGDFDVLTSSEKRGEVSIGTIESDKYTALIQALQTIGVTDILSSPRIATVHNKEARILVGSSEPYVTSTTITPASGPATTSEIIDFIEVGVKLFVTPKIHADGFITMKIRPEVSSVVSTVQTGSNNVIPVVGTTEAETTILLKDGAMIVIGGLIEEDRRTTINKIPLLGSIPYLGSLFKNETEKVTKKEIAIFLKATIITGDVHENVQAELLLKDELPRLLPL